MILIIFMKIAKNGFTVVQTDEYPAVVCEVMPDESSKAFRCNKCGHILISGYNSRAIAGVNIVCFKCRSLNATPHWKYGNPWPFLFKDWTSFRGVHHAGRHTHLKIPSNVLLLSAEEFSLVHQALMPLPRTNSPIHLTSDGLDRLVDELSLLIKKKGRKNWFPDRLRAAEEKMLTTTSHFGVHPLAWAVTILRRSLSARKTYWRIEDGNEGMAILFIMQYKDTVERWSNNANFDVILDALDNEFVHTATMMAAIGHMVENLGLPVSITETVKQIHGVKQSAPDMYMQIGRNETFSIEVKSPSTLLFPDMTMISQEQCNRRVLGLVEEAVKKGQINGEYGGGVVVGASHYDPSFQHIFEQSICFASNNADPEKIATVIGVLYTPSIHFSKTNNIIDLTSNARVWQAPNRNFKGNILFVS